MPQQESRSKMTVSSGAFSFESTSETSTINTRRPMKDDYEFSIDFIELGYSATSSSLLAYGTYEAKVVDINPIREVYWMIKKPGGEWQEALHDEVNGGKSSSLSYSLDSTLGTYEVYVWIFFEDDSMTSYSRKFKVFESFP